VDWLNQLLRNGRFKYALAASVCGTLAGQLLVHQHDALASSNKANQLLIEHLDDKQGEIDALQTWGALLADENDAQARWITELEGLLVGVSEQLVANKRRVVEVTSERDQAYTLIAGQVVEIEGFKTEVSTLATALQASRQETAAAKHEEASARYEEAIAQATYLCGKSASCRADVQAALEEQRRAFHYCIEQDFHRPEVTLEERVPFVVLARGEGGDVNLSTCDEQIPDTATH